MKKKSILILLFLSIVFISLIAVNTLVLGDDGVNTSNSSESPIVPDINFGIDDSTGLPNGTEKIAGVVENLSDEEIRRQYLKQEWTKILNNSKVGKYLLKADGVITKADPVFNILLGIGFSFSWLFVLTIILYIELLDAGYKVINAFQVYYPGKDEYKNLLKWGFFAVFFILFSTIRVAKYVAQFIISIISGKAHWIVQLILMVFVVAFLIIFAIIFDQIKAVFVTVKRDVRVHKNKEEIEKLEKQNEAIMKGRVADAEIKKLENEDEAIKEQAREDLAGAGSDD